MKLLSLTQKNLHQIVIAAAAAIKKGGVVLAPTDTVYGLLADATNPEAVQKVYRIKHREPDKYLPIFVKSMAAAKKYAAISNGRQRLLEEKWPGGFTAVLNQRRDAKIHGTGEKTIALRIPHYPFIESLLEIAGVPLTGTSANISGLPASAKIDEILSQFADKTDLPDLIINAGDLPESKPSTIADMTQKQIKIIRE